MSPISVRQSMRWALIVIDLQKDLCWSPKRRHLVYEALPNILGLIDKFSHGDVPIMYTRFELDDNDEQFARFGDKYCIKGTPGCEFIPEIPVQDGVVIPKHKHSAFFGTDLDQQLHANRVSGVVLAGLQTQICVLTTAADAYQRGYSVVVAEDAVVSTRDEVRLEAVAWIDRYVGKAQPVKEILQWD
jgi:nicotinamidase-related amidase